MKHNHCFSRAKIKAAWYSVVWLLPQREVLRKVQTISHCLQKSLQNTVNKGSSHKENWKTDQWIKIFFKGILLSQFQLAFFFFCQLAGKVSEFVRCLFAKKKSPFSFINSGVTLVILPRATEQEGLISCLLVCSRLPTIFDSWAAAKYSRCSWDASFALRVDVFVSEKFCKQGAKDGVQER